MGYMLALSVEKGKSLEDIAREECLEEAGGPIFDLRRFVLDFGLWRLFVSGFSEVHL